VVIIKFFANSVSRVMFTLDLAFDLLPLPFIPRSRPYRGDGGHELDIIPMLGGADVLRLNVSPEMLQYATYKGARIVKFFYTTSSGWVRMFTAHVEFDSDGDYSFVLKSISLWHAVKRKRFYYTKKRGVGVKDLKENFQEVADIQLLF